VTLAEDAGLGDDIAEIVPRGEPGVAPLSFGQEGLWLFQQLYPDNTALSIIRTLRAAKPLVHGVLELSLSEIVRRHEILRTNFRIIDGHPMQVIRPPEPVSVGLLDFSDLSLSEGKRELVRWLRKRSSEPFNLAEDNLFRADLVRLGEDEEVVFFNLHHIICDAWSLGVLMRETTALYDAILEEKPYPLAELSLQYGDYAAWQRRTLHETFIHEQLSFWRERLAKAPEITALPFDQPRPSGRSFRGAQTSVALERPLVAQLRLLCHRENATMFMVLMAALATLFHRYSGATDIVIGTPVANRSRPEVEPLIGLFMNIVPFRFDLTGDPTFREFLTRVRADAIEVFNNQDVAFETVLSELGVRRQSQNSPLFQSMFVMQPPRAVSLFAEFGVDAAELGARGSKFDFTLALWEHEDGDISGLIEYDTDIFRQSTIDRVFRHYTTLLNAITGGQTVRISSLRMLDDEEHRQAVVGWNDTASPYPEACLHDLFADQARRTPNALALRYEGRGIDYASLERRANRLAWRLRSLGVGPDAIVGICMRRSPAQVVALLAIFKAGGAYLPLDPTYPRDRLVYMLTDAKPRIVITDASSVKSLPALQAVVLDLDAERPSIVNERGTAPPRTTQPDHLAYILYTSGSTGRPKGVMGTHRAIVNRLHWDVPRPASKEIYAYKTSLGFIDALWEIFMPLIRGQSTIVVPDEVARDPSRLVDLLSSENATRMVVVPSFLSGILHSPKDLAQRLQNLSHWAASGETLTSALAALLADRLPKAELFNIYGTSEFWDATWFSASDAAGGASVPIGSPIANMRALVLNSDFEPVPINVAGELFIGGAGLGRGYLGRPGLTAERFVPDPYGDGERLYRTGDVVRRRSDGVLEFVGRRDHQVKLRGHRIELSEIELALQDCPGVLRAVVQLRDDLPSGEPDLVAYLIASSPAPTESTLIKHLDAKLPSYLRPAHFVFIRELPLTPSGKVDRSRLPLPRRRQELHSTHISPRSSLERIIESVWKETLSVEGIGIDDNFFEIGGNSVTLIRIHNIISERVHRDIPIVVLFRYPTIRALASYMVGEQRGDDVDISTKRGEARKTFLTRRNISELRPNTWGTRGTKPA
jgi:amino acid adenylation domain-containing protein